MKIKILLKLVKFWLKDINFQASKEQKWPRFYANIIFPFMGFLRHLAFPIWYKKIK